MPSLFGVNLIDLQERGKGYDNYSHIYSYRRSCDIITVMCDYYHSNESRDYLVIENTLSTDHGICMYFSFFHSTFASLLWQGRRYVSEGG